MNIESLEGANIDSGHYIISARLWTEIYNARKQTGAMQATTASELKENAQQA